MVAAAVHNRVMPMRRRRSPARLWREWKANVRFLSDWLAGQFEPWQVHVEFWDQCANLRRIYAR